MRTNETMEGLALRVSKDDALFLNCLIDSLNEYGIAPPPQLSLPKSIGRVVDYDRVKILMSQRKLRDDDASEEGRKRHRERVKQANQRARRSMEQLRVVACHDPYIWLTGRPVEGIDRLK